MKTTVKFLFLIPALALLSSCNANFNLTPKILGNASAPLNLSPGSTSTLSSFAATYAALASSNAEVLVQGASGTAGAFTSSCGSSGSSCACQFYNSSGTLLGTTTLVGIAYKNSSANQVHCGIGAITASQIASVMITTTNGLYSTVLTPLTATASVTLTQVLAGLTATSVRKVFQYKCDMQYLQKTGTTSTSFTCSAGNLDLLRVRYNNYVYSDGNGNNFGSEASDFLYDNGAICGMQVPQLICTTIDGSTGTPVLEFGLYATQTGPFVNPVQLNVAPQINGVATGGSYTIGYAAAMSTIDNSSCPPGLTKVGIYVTSPSSNTNAALEASSGTSDNNGTDLADTVVAVANPGTQTLNEVPPLSVGTDGYCGGTSCTVPIGTQVTYTPNSTVPFAYTQSGTAFCVINTSLL